MLSSDRPPFRVAFLLISDFSLMAFASAIEPLRVANRLSGKAIYKWTLLSVDDQPVTTSGGLILSTDQSIDVPVDMDMVVVLAGFHPQDHVTDALLRWLRRVQSSRVIISGIDTGSYVMAMAGLLKNSRATTHWEFFEIFHHDFPGIDLTHDRFVANANGRRITAAGGTACIDMMLNLISNQHGNELSRKVADQFIYSHIRQGSDDQRMTLRDRLNVSNPFVVQSVELMENNTEEPLTIKEIAEHLGISLRELERLFHDCIKMTPSQLYRQIRLAKARTLLRHSTMSVTEVAFQSGYVSVSSFSRSFKAHFGFSPKMNRTKLG